MMVVFSKDSHWSSSKVTEDHEMFSKIIELTEDAVDSAYDEGNRYAHLFAEKSDDFDSVYYIFLTTEMI